MKKEKRLKGIKNGRTLRQYLDKAISIKEIENPTNIIWLNDSDEFLKILSKCDIKLKITEDDISKDIVLYGIKNNIIYGMSFKESEEN